MHSYIIGIGIATLIIYLAYRWTHDGDGAEY